MRYYSLLKIPFLALVVSVSFLNPTTSMENPRPYDGEYQIRRYGENESSGTVTLRQPNNESVILEGFKLEGGHYQERIKTGILKKKQLKSKLGGGRTFERLFKEVGEQEDSRLPSNDSLFEQGEQIITEYIRCKLPNAYLKLHLISSPGSTSAQYGSEDEYNEKKVHVRFHVEDKDSSEPEFSIYIAYPYNYHYKFGKAQASVSSASPMERFILIKII